MNPSPLPSLGAHSAGAPFGTSYTRSTSINAGPSSATSSLYDFASGPKMSPSSVTTQSTGNGSNAVVQAAASMFEIQRLREELQISKAKLKNWEESLYQARTVRIKLSLFIIFNFHSEVLQRHVVASFTLKFENFTFLQCYKK